MKKIKKISLAWVVIPLIYGGCVQDNISKVEPPKHSNKDINSSKNGKDNNSSLKSDNNKSASIKEQMPVYLVDENNPLIKEEFEKNSIKVPKVISLEEEDELNETTTATLASTTVVDNDLLDSSSDNIIIDDTQESASIAPTVQEIEDNWEELSKEDEIIETAKSFLGTKYVWAANGPNAFDCSGFTKYVFREIGIDLPRYSGHQAKVGIPVTFDELQKGDLVFFDTEHKFRGKVNHVGIYIGDNKFIHASSAKKKVIITSFSEKPFYRKRFLKGERVIDVVDTSTYASL
jgi:cell wall-associated NlpC family hydrolase